MCANADRMVVILFFLPIFLILSVVSVELSPAWMLPPRADLADVQWRTLREAPAISHLPDPNVLLDHYCLADRNRHHRREG